MLFTYVFIRRDLRTVSKSQVWLYTPVIPLFESLRQKNFCELEARLGYRVNPCLKKKKKRLASPVTIKHDLIDRPWRLYPFLPLLNGAEGVDEGVVRREVGGGKREEKL